MSKERKRRQIKPHRDPRHYPHNASAVAKAIEQLSSENVKLSKQDVSYLADRLKIKPNEFQESNEFAYCDAFRKNGNKEKYFFYSDKGLHTLAQVAIKAATLGISHKLLSTAEHNSEHYGMPDFSMADYEPHYEETIDEMLTRMSGKPDGFHEWPTFITPVLKALHESTNSLYVQVQEWAGYKRENPYHPDTPRPQHVTEPEARLLESLFRTVDWLRNAINIDAAQHAEQRGK
jgi:hypothetical protein